MKIHHVYFISVLFLSFIVGCTASPEVQKNASKSTLSGVAEKEGDSGSSITLKEEGPRLQQKEAKRTEVVANQSQKTNTPPMQAPKKKGKKKEKPQKSAKKTKKKIEKKKDINTKPKEKKVPVEKKSEPKKDIIAEFEGVEITKETYVQTKSEIEIVVDELNRITARKAYFEWLKYISDDYKKAYSNPVRLKAVSEALPIKGIHLKSLRDYFSYVFVPSRQNICVDDIHFVSPTRVEVIMERNNSKLLVYSIENLSDGWKLIPPK